VNDITRFYKNMGTMRGKKLWGGGYNENLKHLTGTNIQTTYPTSKWYRDQPMNIRRTKVVHEMTRCLDIFTRLAQYLIHW